VRRPLPALLLVAALLAGCGDAETPTTSAPATAASTRAAAEPELARAPRRPGEIVLRGDASPRVHGPIELDGRYQVRFQQYAPEDPNLDFADQTTFVVDLEDEAGGPPTQLFHAAAAAGARRIELHGRRSVNVSFGDFPYVVRFTPVGRSRAG
jgi:hypothetical protein